METLFQQVSKNRQSYDYVELVKFGIHKLRIQIRSDSYKEQCYAWLERFDGTKWQHLHSIPFSEMNTPPGLVYLPEEKRSEKNFLADRTLLLSVAKLIIL